MQLLTYCYADHACEYHGGVPFKVKRMKLNTAIAGAFMCIFIFLSVLKQNI